jgi:MoaA/NifB/PqqE/SkfB family radical SAM enzyme
MYKTVTFEIYGICNAKCPWCVTGNRSLLESCYPSSFINIEDFEKVIDRLIELKLIGDKTVIILYSWGEPLIHPQFNDILKILSSRNIAFSISTNASKPVKVERGLLTQLRQVTISMPGFSQKSYDRIHGFKFKKILRNIDIILDNFIKAGFIGKVRVSYHIYQFNLGEMQAAKNFCDQRKISFSPYVAYLNDFNLTKSYLNDTLRYETLKKLSKDLLLYYIEETIALAPKNYVCPQYDMLTIDERCHVLTCCVVPKDHPDYSIGSFFYLSPDEIKKLKVSQKICKECLSSGQAYLAHNAPCPNFILEQRRSKIPIFIKRIIPEPLKLFIKKRLFHGGQ